MAFATNDLIAKFGTLTSIDDGSTSSIASAAFSVAADISAWTSPDDVPYARFILMCQFATVTSVANKPAIIHARPINIDGTDDPVAPSASRLMSIGQFNVYAAAVTTNYYFESSLCELPLLKSGQEIEFYLENLTGQTISAGWTLKMMPLSYGPKA
jgi:hypothetical protein